MHISSRMWDALHGMKISEEAFRKTHNGLTPKVRIMTSESTVMALWRRDLIDKPTWRTVLRRGKSGTRQRAWSNVTFRGHMVLAIIGDRFQKRPFPKRLNIDTLRRERNDNEQ